MNVLFCYHWFLLHCSGLGHSFTSVTTYTKCTYSTFYMCLCEYVHTLDVYVFLSEFSLLGETLQASFVCVDFLYTLIYYSKWEITRIWKCNGYQ